MTSHVWTAGPFRGWPLSQEEESQFIDEARAAVTATPRSKTPLRCDVTALVVALRDGAQFADITDFLPGLRPDTLVRAHDYLTKRSDEARKAWEGLVAKPTHAGLKQYARRASILLPIPVAELVRVAETSASASALEHAVHSTVARLEEDTLYAYEVEDDLTKPFHSGARKSRIGAELFHPQNASLWGGAYYMPRRVADLSPLRVMDLLGERTR